jgi:enterochelin esterase-like enzyme
LKNLNWFLLLILLLPDLCGCGGHVNARGAEQKPIFPDNVAGQEALLTEGVRSTQTKSATSISLSESIVFISTSTVATASLKATTQTPQSTPQTKHTFGPTSTPIFIACMKAGGFYESGEVITELLRDPLQYRVYLPPCYREQPDQRYPVLYLFHGLQLPVTQWDRIGVDEAADRLIASGKIPPLIIVMPYDPFTSPPGVNKFDQAIVEGLVPHIDRIFRTLPDRSHRAVGGLSRGGAWAIHLGLTYWQVFGAIGGHSPAIFSNDYSQLKELVQKIPQNSYPRIYLDIGDRDDRKLLNDLIVFENRLDALSVPHEWHYFLGYHNEAYWHAHVEQYLLWYSEVW